MKRLDDRPNHAELCGFLRQTWTDSGMGNIGQLTNWDMIGYTQTGHIPKLSGGELIHHLPISTVPPYYRNTNATNGARHDRPPRHRGARSHPTTRRRRAPGRTPPWRWSGTPVAAGPGSRRGEPELGSQNKDGLNDVAIAYGHETHCSYVSGEHCNI